MAVSPHGYSDDFGQNVSNILCGGSRVIRGRVPAEVRAQLRAAVRAGVLGHLPKDGLKPEIYFHPDHKNMAKEIQYRYARADIEAINSVMANTPVEQRIEEAITGFK